MREAKRRMNRLHWIKQIVPRTLWSIYHDNEGRRWFSIWRQWLGRAYDHRRIPVG